MKDYYKILGIPRNSSKDEIKKAYRKLAHKYHPDKKGGNEQKFKELNEAYQILFDTKQRMTYDKEYFDHSSTDYKDVSAHKEKSPVKSISEFEKQTTEEEPSFVEIGMYILKFGVFIGAMIVAIALIESGVVKMFTGGALYLIARELGIFKLPGNKEGGELKWYQASKGLVFALVGLITFLLIGIAVGTALGN